MRNAFVRSLEELAAHDDRIVLLSGDIGNRMFDRFKSSFPQRFFNVGIAEGNMIGVAAGMAMSGLRPIVYTIAPFLTARCLEQIRIDLCYHRAPVVLAGVGAGLSYASLGPTHHSLEDIAWLRSLPAMTVVCPGDAMEVSAALPQLVELGAPSYLRLGKKNEPVVHAEAPDFRVGRGLVLAPGADVTLLVTGTLLPIAIDTAAQLRERGCDTGLVSFHTVKPLDELLLAELHGSSTLLVTLEEHSRLGGFGGAVAEWLCDHELSTPQQGSTHRRTRLLRIGTEDSFVHDVGSHGQVRDRLGLGASELSTRIEQTWHTLRTTEIPS